MRGFSDIGGATKVAAFFLDHAAADLNLSRLTPRFGTAFHRWAGLCARFDSGDERAGVPYHFFRRAKFFSKNSSLESFLALASAQAFS